jgi:UDP-3-O-[3-hydroxymyristoyl] N-acetylglucosamine deacetylase
MAAFAGLEIDNALVRLDGPEVPIMDGSSAQFVEGLIRAGVRSLSAKRTYLRVKKAFEIKNSDQFIKLEPANTASYKCSIHFEKGKVIGYQTTTYKPSMEAFLDISKARTFCHINDVNAMRQRGLAMGGSLENAVVIDDAKVMNREGLRDKREFVKHKLLDLIGDFHLFGAPVMAKVTAHKAGHRLHHEAVSQLLSKSEQYLEMFVMEGDGEQTRSKVVPVQFPDLAFG